MDTNNNELSEKHLKWLDLEKRKQVLRDRDLKIYLNSDKLAIPLSKKGTYEEEAKKLKIKAFKQNEKSKFILKFFETRERNKENDADFKKIWTKKLKELNKEFAPKKTTPKPVIEKKKEEPKKTTPKPVIEKKEEPKKLPPKTLAVLKKYEEEDIKKRKERNDNLDKRDKAFKEYKDQQVKKGRSIKFFTNDYEAIKKEFNNIWAKKKRDEKKATPEPVIKKKEKRKTYTEIGKTNTYKLKGDKSSDIYKMVNNKLVLIDTPEPVIKNVIIEKKEEPKKTSAVRGGKQTADQLAKRRAKYQENRDKELARKKAYREANKEEINAKQDARRNTKESKDYQKAYREKHSKKYEPKRTKAEVEAGVKAFGLGKDKERYAVDINKKLKENKPRKERTDRGKERGKYDIITKAEMIKKYPRPKRKSGESEEVFNTRWGLWEKVVNRRLPVSMLTMKNAVKITYGEGINVGGKSMTTSEWMRKIEKEEGRDIEKDGLGRGNLLVAESDPDAVY